MKKDTTWLLITGKTVGEKENRELEEKLVRYTLKRLLENIWHNVQNIPKQSARSF